MPKIDDWVAEGDAKAAGFKSAADGQAAGQAFGQHLAGRVKAAEIERSEPGSTLWLDAEDALAERIAQMPVPSLEAAFFDAAYEAFKASKPRPPHG